MGGGFLRVQLGRRGTNRRASRYLQTEEQQRGGREPTRNGRRHRKA